MVPQLPPQALIDRPPASGEAPFSSLPLQLAREWPIERWRHVGVLLAVSGGADSMAMLHAFAALKADAGGRGSIEVAHVNHRWRGAESDSDAQFVAATARRLGLRAVLLDARSMAPTTTDEQSARRARYALLTTAAHERGDRYVVTAHTVDDQLETLLHRLIRGTGLRGLRGIPAVRRMSQVTSVVRPMLSCRRAALLDHLRQIEEAFRTDSTNTDLRYTRNRIRHVLLPQLRKHWPDIDERLLALQQKATDCYREQCDRVARAIASNECAIDHAANRLTLPRSALRRLPRSIASELLRTMWREIGWPEGRMSADDWLRCVGTAHTTQSAHSFDLPEAIRVQTCGEQVVLSRTNRPGKGLTPKPGKY